MAVSSRKVAHTIGGRQNVACGRASDAMCERACTWVRKTTLEWDRTKTHMNQQEQTETHKQITLHKTWAHLYCKYKTQISVPVHRLCNKLDNPVYDSSKKQCANLHEISPTSTSIYW